MNETRMCMSYSELLEFSQSAGDGSNRLEVMQLPHDPALQSRYVLTVAGPNAGSIMNMITDALDRYFGAPVAAHTEDQDAHGPDSSAAEPD